MGYDLSEERDMGCRDHNREQLRRLRHVACQKYEVCIVVRGGDLRFLSPYDGCFAVLVDRSEGVVAGKFKEKDTPLVLLDDVATEIASLFGPATAPQKVESATRPQMAVTRPPKPTKPSTTRNLEASEAPKVAVAPEAPKATASKSPASSADSLKHQL